MASFGLSNLCVAPVTAETASAITYSAGKMVEHARRAAMTYNWVEGKLKGDNKTAEYMAYLEDADLELETTELDNDVAVMMGLVKTKGTSNAQVYQVKTLTGTPVGIGWMETLMVNNEYIYRGVWVHKVTLRQNSTEASTREDTINWGTPTVQGKCWCVLTDADGEDQVRDYKDFETEAAAVTWLKGKAGITP